jgi:hypothetical protein
MKYEVFDMLNDERMLHGCDQRRSNLKSLLAASEETRS